MGHHLHAFTHKIARVSSPAPSHASPVWSRERPADGNAPSPTTQATATDEAKYVP